MKRILLPILYIGSVFLVGLGILLWGIVALGFLGELMDIRGWELPAGSFLLVTFGSVVFWAMSGAFLTEKLSWPGTFFEHLLRCSLCYALVLYLVPQNLQFVGGPDQWSDIILATIAAWAIIVNVIFLLWRKFNQSKKQSLA